MNRFLAVNFMVFMLFVSLLANGFASAFHGEVFMHELGHNHQHSLSTAHAEHPHNEFPDEKELDLSPHICFSVVYQPLLFAKLPLIPSVAGKEILSESITFQIPTSIPDSPFRPPRNIFPS
ncbi:MAG: hypothetical protein KF908_12065 [Nitrosomonas sp.]|jgi:hypothetical protein|uniref:Cobalt-zinc-cadmium efflux system protein n=1 Tax=Nitrosomonas aestuarii TaxID=52441 RepID=A0A1I4H359_9PROT|nr:hypothetical protein [Nitrosomonas aestuarii]MBX3630617.1 hypothetical protein [Nitrosomonas sp.]SFL36718.1 hypothetical protein SAMN05216302_10696 [Nitrosomonas aestuarii]